MSQSSFIEHSRQPLSGHVAVPRLWRYDAAGAVGLADQLAAIDASLAAMPDRLIDAGRLPGVVLVSAAIEARLVGYAIGSLLDDTVRIEPLAVVSALPAAEAEAIVGSLVEEILAVHSRPWAQISLPAGSSALAHLLRRGWRPTSGRPTTGDLVLCGAEARP